MLGKLSWAAMPLNEPLPLMSGAVVVLIVARGARDGRDQGLGAVFVARMVDQRRSQAPRRHVFRAGAADAGARLYRCDHDAHAAGNSGRRARRVICRPSTTIRSFRRTARS